MTRRRIEKLLRAHRIRRFDAETVLTTLRTPPLPVAPGAIEAASAHVALLLPRLRLLRAQREGCEQRIEALLARLQPPETPGLLTVTKKRGISDRPSSSELRGRGELR